MKIIISPAKVQDGKTRFDLPFEPLLYKCKTDFLRNDIGQMTKNQVGKLMKIKNKLLDTTYDFYQTDQETYHAVNLYNGIVYKEINTNLYDAFQVNYMQEHLRILSAMYGVLEPLTGIKPYRLDMTMKPNKLDLYKYWQEDVENHFTGETIVNLASLEFSKMIPFPMVNIHFKELKDEEYKIVTVRAKKARGLMVDYMISNMVSDIEGIKHFTEDGYRFNQGLSDENNLTFTKE